VISSHFSNILHELLPYLMCLLCGCRLNAALQMGDPLLRLNITQCIEEHRLLERIGRAYKANLRCLVKSSVRLGIVKRVVDLSVDPTHVLYWGEKAVKRWGSPFSTMMNRALPGLYPLTCLDLLSGLFLFASDFIGKAKKDRKGKTKDLGKVTGKKILGCVDFLRDAGMRVRSITGDEGMCSDYLIEELGKRGIHHLLAVTSRSKLRALVPTIKEWVKLQDGKLLGIKRNIEHNGVGTNLIVVKDDDRTYLYVSSYTKGARYVWERFCRRGRHENRIGVAKSIGLEDGRPSTSLFQVKGHALACIYLLILLRVLCENLGLDPDTEPETIRNLLTRQCYVRWDAATGRMTALVIVSRTMLEKIGRSSFEWEGGSIELLWYQTRRARGGKGGRGRGASPSQGQSG
jgi:hypothetical protein